MNAISIRRPDDFHVHLRQDRLLELVLPYTAKVFARALAMPNTNPPLTKWQEVNAYYWKVKSLGKEYGFEPIRCLYLTDNTTRDMVFTAYALGANVCKLYPAGATTNSQQGVKDIKAIFPALEAMEKTGMILSVHGGKRGAFCLDAEREFLPVFWEIYCAFPKLKIVWEHVTTKELAELLKRYPDRVAATITAHHLVLTLDDVIGNKINPHNFCKPVAKRPADREALIQAALSGNPKFFFGSDSAPHNLGLKENGSGNAGIYSAPVAMPLLAEIFEKRGALDKLEDFTSRFGADFYRLPYNTGTLTLVKEPHEVPYYYDGLAPFMAGPELKWRIKE